MLITWVISGRLEGGGKETFSPGSCVLSERPGRQETILWAGFNPVQLGKLGPVPFSVCVMEKHLCMAVRTSPAGPGLGAGALCMCLQSGPG